MAATVAPKDDVNLVAAAPDRSLHLWGHTPLCCRPDFTWGCCQHWQAAAGRKGCDWRVGASTAGSIVLGNYQRRWKRSASSDAPPRGAC